MQTVGRIFDSKKEAAGVVDALIEIGVFRENITIFGPPSRDPALSSGPTIGIVLGASAGLLMSIFLVVDGVIPVGATWLAAAIAGSVGSGSVAGSFIGTALGTKRGPGTNYRQAVYLVIAEVEEDVVQMAETAVAAPHFCAIFQKQD